ncbi:DIP1984 family protein [Herbiconiux sp. L3-i23]|uniref:DIP1984 family protein n=1 Tax=Herbiconiux sp. L3-i23 TaxID=2905871 RepID=UPI0020737886|nr:DIP1984 family protein [Herbiconiux sp. L3-i23]
MRLAEALMERGDLQKRIEQLRARIAANARYQEGEEPGEDAAALLLEAIAAVDALGVLVARINATNAITRGASDLTVTDLLASRDTLRMQHSLLTSAADAATGASGFRQLRSELRTVSALPAGELRLRADEVAKRLREVDSEIQRINWEADLLGE